MNLSTLNGRELRRLLDSSRARGDAPLSYQILQEMAARRDAKPARGKAPARRDLEPRVVDLNLGDPLEPEDDVPPMPSWPPPAAEAEVEAAPPAEPQPALQFRDVEAPPFRAEPASQSEFDLRLHPPRPERPPARGRFRAGAGVGLAVGVTLGVGLGWWAGMTGLGPLSPAPVAPIQTAQLEVVPPPAATPVAAAPVEPEAAPEPPLETLPSPPPEPAEPVVEPEPPAETVATKAVAGACAAEPTPADREICADPELQRLQRDLRQAYAEALDAHEDRDLLRQRQLAWRDARNEITDPGRLMQLYEQRIRRLNAATAEALRQR